MEFPDRLDKVQQGVEAMRTDEELRQEMARTYNKPKIEDRVEILEQKLECALKLIDALQERVHGKATELER